MPASNRKTTKKSKDQIAMHELKQHKHHAKERERQARAYEAHLEENKTRDESLLEEIRGLYKQLENAVKAYSKAALENKEDLLSKFKEVREQLTEQVGLLSHNSKDLQKSYRTYINKLSEQVNLRSYKLAQQEEALKKIILDTAKRVEKDVQNMSVTQQIYTIAPANVKKALESISEKVTPRELKNLLSTSSIFTVTSLLLDTVDVNSSLVNAQTGEVTQHQSNIQEELKEELNKLSLLSPDQQSAIALALLTGNDPSGVLQNFSPSTQIALIAVLMDQLATKLSDNKKDQVAIQKFAKDLVSTVVRLEQGEATYLSVLALIENNEGKEVIAQFHIDLATLSQNPTEIAAILNFHLLKIGVKSDTPLATVITNGAQAATLLQLEGKTLSALGGNIKNLEELTNRVLENTLANSNVGDDNALTISGSNYVINLKRDKINSAKGDIIDPLKLLAALAIVRETAQQTVFDLNSQAKSGITKLLEAINSEKLEEADEDTLEEADEDTLEDVNEDTLEDVNENTLEDVNENTLEDVNENKLEDAGKIQPKATNNEIQPSYYNDENNDVIKDIIELDADLIKNFTSALGQLDQLDGTLKKKYSDKHLIVEVNQQLIKTLTRLLSNYESNGNKKQFQDDCNNALDNVKKHFATHRDNSFVQFFANIIHALTSFFNSLFESAESKKVREDRNAFFNSDSRPTNSAKVLYNFKQDLDKAFESLEQPDVKHGTQFGTSC